MDKKIFFKDVVVVPNFAKNLISVRRLTENGKTFETNKHGAKLTYNSGKSLNLRTDRTEWLTFLLPELKQEQKLSMPNEPAKKTRNRKETATSDEYQ